MAEAEFSFGCLGFGVWRMTNVPLTQRYSDQTTFGWRGVMPRLIRRIFRRTKRQIRVIVRDWRTRRLYEAARHLLAHDDLEQVTVARIAAEAGVSVGAFYERFPSKDNFLGRLIDRQLRGATDSIEQELNLRTWGHRDPEDIVRAIVEHIVSTLHGADAGIVRTALKRGASWPAYLEPLAEYRRMVAQRAVSLLAHRVQGVGNPKLAVRAIIQMLHATMLDALLQDHGPLRAGRPEIVHTMCGVTMLSLGISTSGMLEDVSAGQQDDDDESMIDIPTEDVVPVEVSESVPRSVVSQRRRAPPKAAAKSVKVIYPKDIENQLAVRPRAPSGRRRVRFI
jgi:AcrR family transcriptional regulator